MFARKLSGLRHQDKDNGSVTCRDLSGWERQLTADAEARRAKEEEEALPQRRLDQKKKPAFSSSNL
jgi:hypothetical protein